VFSVARMTRRGVRYRPDDAPAPAAGALAARRALAARAAAARRGLRGGS
jgi:hypothetical protein